MAFLAKCTEVIGEQALWSWRGVIKKFARGGHKKNFQGGAGGGSIKIFYCWFRRFRTKTDAGASRRKIFFFQNFFFLKKTVASLKSSKSGVGGQKPFLRGWGWFWRLGGGHEIFFQRGVAPLQPHPLLTYDRSWDILC